jgi:hypothetical protein
MRNLNYHVGNRPFNFELNQSLQFDPINFGPIFSTRKAWILQKYDFGNEIFGLKKPIVVWHWFFLKMLV